MRVWIYDTQSQIFLFTISPFAAPKEAIHTESGCNQSSKRNSYCNGKPSESYITEKENQPTNKQIKPPN